MFTDETGIRIKTVARVDKKYKESVYQWLTGDGYSPDILNWHTSKRLFYFASRKAILPINEMLKDPEFVGEFKHVLSNVIYEGDLYAVPTSYYHWGFLYKKSLVNAKGKVPQHWDEFIALCKQLKAEGVTPIGIGTKNLWPVAAWFDYINLRTNGLEFHQQLLNGKISFFDPRVRQVFSTWKQMIDSQFFLSNSDELRWDQVLPLLYRDKVAFNLIGNFATSKILETEVEQIGFMPFPKINDIPRYEEAPMDAFMVSAKTNRVKESILFLKFIAREDIQSLLNNGLGYLSPNIHSKSQGDRFLQQGAKLLKESQGVSQYFDRDTVPEFDVQAMPILVNFLHHPDIDTVTRQLEITRIKVFKPTN